MSRRESNQSRRHFSFDFGKALRRVSSASAATRLKSPTSPVELISRSVASMKRFFTNTKNVPSTEEKPAKRARLQKKPAQNEPVPPPVCEPIIETRETLRPNVDRSRRNGVVFDDITIWSTNVSPTSPVPRESKTIFHLSDVDFTKPQPEWLTSTIIHSPLDLSPSALAEPPTFLSPYHRGINANVKVLDFLSPSEYEAIRAAIDLSMSAFPSRRGYLQNTLFVHVVSSLTTILNRAESGLQEVWGTRKIRLPAHYVTALTYLVSTLESLSESLTKEVILLSDIDEICGQYSSIVNLAVQTASIIDGMDIRSLIGESVHNDVKVKLNSSLQLLILASSHAEENFELLLQTLAQKLPSSVPTMLLPLRLQVYKTLIQQYIRRACDRIASGSTLSRVTIDKLDRLIPIAKRIQRQLDRIALDENEPVDNISRKDLVNFDLERTMLQAFLDGLAALTPLAAITFYDLAKTLAKPVNQPHIQAECLYRIASLATSIRHYSGVAPVDLLLTARELNDSRDFQRKVNDMLTIIRRRSISSILDMAPLVHQAPDLNEFIDGVKIFVSTLMARYPAEGIDGETVLDNDVVKGLLKVVRVFHPDKNTCVDEEGRWICEEVTKVLGLLLGRLMLDLEQAR